MLASLATLATSPDLEAETVIVGAGAVGLAMAVDLARRGRDVLVLEAGGEVVERASQAQFELAEWRGHRLEGLHAGRYRALGGSTVFWGGQVTPLDPVVFEDRPWMGAPQWPIGPADLAPFEARAYDLLGLSRRLPDEAVWERLAAPRPSFGDDVEMLFTRWLPEPNFARLFAADIRGAGKLRVATGAQVTALDVSGGAVTALNVHAGERGVGVRGRHVVLACGTVEIARLLALPTARDERAPWADNPWLGRGFMDHVQVEAGTVSVTDARRFHDLFDNLFADGIKYQPKLKLSAKAQRERRLGGVAAHFEFRSRHDDTLRDAKTFVRGLLSGRLQGSPLRSLGALGSAAAVGVPMALRYLRDRRMYNPTDRGVGLRLSAEQKPLATSRLELTERRDAAGALVPQVTWDVEPEILETLAQFGEALGAALAREGLAAVTLNPTLAARDPAFLTGVGDAYHQMGLARMSRDAADGVVGTDLKVHGTDNLYVAGASVFPTAGFENPTFTAIALALRLGEQLAGQV